MAVEKKFGSVKRFGPRYGARLKSKFAEVELEQRKKHNCPYCNKPQVKRLALGIWQCRKCGSKFGGKAYTFSKGVVIKEEVKKEEIEQPVEFVEKREEEKEEKKEGKV